MGGEHQSSWRRTSRSRVENQQTPAWELNTSHIGKRRVRSPLRHPCFPTIKRDITLRIKELNKLVELYT